ncbi:hypothetical protein BBJ29_001658 [Phytophthora kernoviae]|uniref:THH1/TOM1/TOM3 domain-containing protein n=1 Tax=Phytophthora kernoviae TaxID=325452 RepID=A0A3F2RRT9_9STRA|nr:hypothetical protein BBP00_00004399 [Phytophthora kernoviae]RLN71107.1 hypothetical protein BBJ29_001658 [Phytophthora kernoviae]
MANITEATCDFGLALTDDGCVRTLASYDPSAYHNTQAIYLAVGGISIAASVILYVRSVKYDGGHLQQYTLLFCWYAAATIFMRGADPLSYGHVVPRPISAFLADTCTAALYSCYIMSLGYWATIMRKSTPEMGNPQRLACLERIAMAAVWAFQMLYSVCLFFSKGFSPHGLVYMQLTMCGLILGIISMVFLIYGLRMLAKLRIYEKQQKLQMPSIRTNRMLSNRSFDLNTSDGEDDADVARDRKIMRSRPKENHAAKIRTILIMAETVSLVVVVSQVYTAIIGTRNTPVELSCANGMLCEDIKCHVSLLHMFQVSC